MNQILTWDNGLLVFHLAGDSLSNKKQTCQSPHSEVNLLTAFQQEQVLDGTGIRLKSSPANLWVPQPGLKHLLVNIILL